MKNQVLIVVMTTIGIGLGLNPIINKINPRLLKGSTWLLSGIVSKLIK